MILAKQGNDIALFLAVQFTHHVPTASAMSASERLEDDRLTLFDVCTSARCDAFKSPGGRNDCCRIISNDVQAHFTLQSRASQWPSPQAIPDHSRDTFA